MEAGPTQIMICNGNPKCKYLDAWYNTGMQVHGRCGKSIWEGIRSWSPKESCITPKECPFIRGNQTCHEGDI
jgi:hypothetical protein